VALLRKETYYFRHPLHLRHPVPEPYTLAAVSTIAAPKILQTALLSARLFEIETKKQIHIKIR